MFDKLIAQATEISVLATAILGGRHVYWMTRKVKAETLKLEKEQKD